MQAKNIVIIILVLVLIGAIGYLFINNDEATEGSESKLPTTEETEEMMPVEPDEGIGGGAKPLPEISEVEERGSESILGTSVEGKDIIAYHFGDGANEVLFVGGVHGGYSPNTAELAEELVTYLKGDENIIPDGVMVTVIPNLNPDGLTKSGSAGRFNANEVDINRNFDCEWSETAVWQNNEVSGGSEPFSEPEADALRKYVEEYEPAAAVVWFSAEGKVYPSACAGTPSNASVELAATFATAANYPAEAEFDSYAITGDMVNWMAKQNIPAISVLLSDHASSEWTKNKAGIEAVLNAYAE